MIPISDENPTLRTPVMTWIVLGALFAIWVSVQGAGVEVRALVSSICTYGLLPAELTGLVGPGTVVRLGRNVGCVVDDSPLNMLTPLTSMFLHGSWGHIVSNALFLWVFGNNIEDSMGPGRFLAFFLVCGLVAGGVHVLIDPGSAIPTVGASGAISGVLGAYLVLYPRVRVNMFFLLTTVALPAWLVLVWWFVVQVVMGLPELSSVRPEVTGGVAVWAHIGGFIAGLLLIRFFENRRMVIERNEIRLRMAHPPHESGGG
jgi:membrane associated rhomboid family serine protease